MAVQLPLPEPSGLPEQVLFHREHPSDPMLLLQVPNPGATDSETYVIRLDNPKHNTWVERLKGSRWLRDLLQMEMHVVYEPATGRMQALRDLDEPPPFAQDVTEARRMAGKTRGYDHYFTVRRRQVPAMSRLRMGLLGIAPGRHAPLARGRLQR